MINRLTDHLNFQAEALVLRSERQRLVASNIANADTPGYISRDLNSAQALRDATSGGAMGGRQGSKSTSSASGALGASTTTMASSQGPLDSTHARHIQPGSTGREDRNLIYASPSQSNLDGNTVDMDRERAAFADNAVKYEASLRFINGSVRTMLDAIKGQS